ncbi:hypothetical protein EB73_34785 [Mycobacterium sp. SWH-M3]|nr:hypothetical protein EB73_34785 [Mycobacterium sp. SWH-M3]
MLEPGTLTGMKSLVGAFLAIMAVNSAPGLPAGLTTYLTVLVAAIALGAFFVSRRIKKKRGHASVATPAPPSPTIVQYIYTTGPVVTATPSHPGGPGPMYVPADRGGQVYLPGSVYHGPAH